jgi:hypothetical protein
MADVNINIFTNKIYKQGASTVVPGFIQGEEPTPINPSGSGGASEFVPYVGATENFDLGEFGMSAGFFKLDTTPTNTPTDQGTFYWDEDDNTVDIILNGYIMKVGEDLFYPVKNQTGSSIPKGTNVRFAGTVGNSGRLLITPYLADGTYATSRYMGVTAETIGNGEDGKVLWFGRIRGINTNAYNEGDTLYASTTSAGGFQTTLPVAPNNIVEVAEVVTKSVNNGVIFVRPQFLSGSTPLLIEKTFTEAQSLVSSNSLVKGAIYKISGFYKDKISSDYPLTFYNDGNNLGTTIYLTALTGNTFSREGWGEFYNPIYYSYDDYENIDGTGLYGIWDGDNPDAGEIPDYAEDQVVFWGGYAWNNLTGDVGTADDVLNLDSTNWEKIPYSNTTYYQKVIDYIEADFTEDVVLRRVDRLNNIDVLFSATLHYDKGFVYHPISVMCWGNSDFLNLRLTDIQINDSYCEFINFKGFRNYSNKLDFFGIIEKNYFGIQSVIHSNIITKNYSGIFENTIKYSQISTNTIDNSSSISFNIMYESNIFFNNLNIGNISSCELDESTISFNNIYQNSSLNFSTSGILTLKTISKIDVRNSNVNQDISSATIIFGDYSKQIFKRQDGTPRLGYYNNSDVFTVVDIDA